jgi:hypothetical protein
MRAKRRDFGTGAPGRAIADIWHTGAESRPARYKQVQARPSVGAQRRTVQRLYSRGRALDKFAVRSFGFFVVKSYEYISPHT